MIWYLHGGDLLDKGEGGGRGGLLGVSRGALLQRGQLGIRAIHLALGGATAGTKITTIIDYELDMLQNEQYSSTLPNCNTGHWQLTTAHLGSSSDSPAAYHCLRHLFVI